MQDELERKGWNMSRLSEKTGLSHTYIRHLVHGEVSGKKAPPSPTLETVDTLAKALGIDPVQILYAYKGIDPRTKPPLQLGVAKKLMDFLVENYPDETARVLELKKGEEQSE